MRSQINNKKNEISRLTNDETSISKFLDLDLGPEKIFASLYEKCFDFQVKEYIYKFCMFKNVKQSHTDIGNWKEWKNGYETMVYEGGAHCWNGPTRQTTVRLLCGEEDKITSVDEPSKCIYSATFETPVACSPDDIEKLELLFSGDIF